MQACLFIGHLVYFFYGKENIKRIIIIGLFTVTAAALIAFFALNGNLTKRAPVMAEIYVSVAGSDSGENDYREKQIYIDKKWDPRTWGIMANAGRKKFYGFFANTHFE